MNRFAKATFRFAVSLTILLAAALCRADDAPQRTRPMDNRFLFVIDTSSSMRSRTNGIEEAIGELLRSDMHGEFREGDTIGVWTYDEDLHANFPMQVWSPEKKDEITRDVLRYMRHQHYEHRAHLDKILTAIGRVIEQSERLTVILIYDGTETIRGTEFDGDINDLQKKYERSFRAAHMPMVTILAARHTQVFDYSINYPGSITVPHTAYPVPPPETNATPVEAVAAAPPTSAPPAEPTPPPRRIQIIMSGTNSITRTIPGPDSAADNPSPAPSNVVMAGTQPSPPTPAPASAIPAPVAVEPTASNPPPPAPKPEPAVPEPASVTAQPEPTPVPPSAPPKTAPPPAPLPTFAPAPAPVRPAVTSTGHEVALFIIAFSLLTIAVVLVVLVVRRLRGDAAPSLISQSIDRGR
jgi:hypothetical protein